MMRLNLQFFGGRGSAGGNAKESAVSKAAAAPKAPEKTVAPKAEEKKATAKKTLADAVRAVKVSTGQYVDEKGMRTVEKKVGSLLSAMEVGDTLSIETTREAEVNGERTTWNFTKTKNGYEVNRYERIYAGGRFENRQYPEKSKWKQKNVVSQVQGSGAYNINISKKGEYSTSTYWENKKRR